MGLFDLFSKKKLDTGLLRTREGFLSRLGKIVTGKTIVDDEVLDNLEETLITADVGTETTLKIISNIQKRIEREKKIGTERLNEILKEEISSLLIDNPFHGFSVPQPLSKGVLRDSCCGSEWSREDHHYRKVSA